MKKIILSLGMIVLAAGAVSAQGKKGTTTAKAETKTANVNATLVKDGKATAMAPTPAAPGTKAGAGAADAMVFKTDVHDFGTLPEGPAADYEFVFTNTGKEPLVLDRVQASCGCTTPSYSKEPVMPGKTGTIKASYNTQGRPGPFTKSITAFTNQGTKVITIKGTVEKGPEGSVPENNSMIKTH